MILSPLASEHRCFFPAGSIAENQGKNTTDTHTHIFVRKASDYMTVTKLIPIKGVYKSSKRHIATPLSCISFLRICNQIISKPNIKLASQIRKGGKRQKRKEINRQ